MVIGPIVGGILIEFADDYTFPFWLGMFAMIVLYPITKHVFDTV